MNAVQATQDAKLPNARIIIDIERDYGLGLDGDAAPISAFTVQDAGIGFDDANFDSFNTAFSEYKFKRGGKGLGRFLWLKAFDAVEIDSVFTEPDHDGLLQRTFRFDLAYDPDLALPVPAIRASTGTTVRLTGFREPYRSTTPKAVEHIAQRLIEHFLLLFLQPRCPTIEIRDGGLITNVNAMFQSEFRAVATAHPFEISGQSFILHGFRLTAPRASRHKLTYAANDRGVLSENLEDYIPNLSGRLTDGDGQSFIYLAIVQSPYLNERVNNTRTDFDIAPASDGDTDQLSLLGTEVKRSDIRDRCLTFIHEDLSDVIAGINAAKSERVQQYVETEAPHYRVLLRRKNEFIDKITPNASRMEIETALHQELYQREVDLKRDGTRIITEAAKLEDYEQYRDKLSAFMQSFNELGVSALAQYVMHRKIILEFFERALSLNTATGKYPLEKIVHDIIFPMRSTSDEILYSQQNLWILDERLNYHAFIASDKPLSTIDTIENDSLKRPDLFIFDRKLAVAEGEQPITSVNVIEFKRPLREDFTPADNPVDQVYDAIKDIRAGRFKDQGGRPIATANDRIPAAAQIICDLTEKSRNFLLQRDFTEMPGGQGFYNYQRHLGIFCEVLDYGKVLRDAKRRNRVLFERLNLLG